MHATILKTRDLLTLQLLSYTQANARLIFKAGEAFSLPEGEE